MKNNPAALVISGVLAVVLGVASLAWACTPQAYIDSSPAEGVSGATITVTGDVWKDGQPVQVYWRDTSGPLLGTGIGPTFSIEVTIPQSEPDTYMLVGVVRNDEGLVEHQKSKAFTVVAEEAPEEPGGGAEPQPGSGGSKEPGSEQSKGSGERGATGSSSEGSAPAAGSTSDTAAAPGPGTIAAAAKSEASDRPARSSSKKSVSRSAAHFFRDVPAPSEGDPLLDRWSGEAGRGAASIDAAIEAPPTTSDRPGSEFMIGAVLLAVGLVSIFGGFLVAEIRRRAPSASVRERRRH